VFTVMNLGRSYTSFPTELKLQVVTMAMDRFIRNRNVKAKPGKVAAIEQNEYSVLGGDKDK
jgi:hypothetical protein